MTMNRITALGAALFLAACAAFAQGRGGRGGANAQQTPPAATTPAPATTPQTPRLPPPEEKTSVTHHKATIGGQQIGYTATAGNYVIKDDAGAPKASFFFVAYTKEDVADATRRPLS